MQPGAQLAHFTLTAQIGTGGMGTVWQARDTKLNRDVALKVLPEAFAEDAERMARFQREAQALAALQHPNIASIYGIEQAEGVTFLVMELCDGDDLSALIERGPLPISEVRDIAAQIARGLEEAHEKGIIHRDLKPANVKVSAEGKVKVLDFGLARTFSDDQSATDISGDTLTAAVDMTRPGVVLGTAAYMSPEQARGKTIDKRTDIWAFGVILYEMLTGTRLFAGETVSDILASVLRQDPDFDALPDDLPIELAWVVRRCLDRNKESRLRDIGEARCLVSADASASSLSLLAAPAPADRPEASRKRPWLWPAVAAIAIGAMLIQYFASPPTGGGPDPLVVTGYTPLTPLSTDAHTGAMAAGGNFFVYTAGGPDGAPDIFLQRGGGLNPINLTPDSPAADMEPAVSPDGQRIAFVSHREGKGVFVMGTTGESARLLAAGGARPAWSPDGRHIVFSTEDFWIPWARDGYGKLRIVPADGGEVRELDLAVEAVQPDWSPDGERIAFWSVDVATSLRDLWSVRPDGTDLVQLTDDPHLDFCPKWSPDGRWVYFLSNRSGMNNLWRLPVDPASGQPQGAAEMMTLPSPDVRHFSFAPGGRGIVYTSVRAAQHMFRVPMDPERLVTTGPAEPLVMGNIIIHSLRASPDGRSVAFVKSGVREDLFIIGADGTGLRQLTNDDFRDRGPSWIDDGRRLIFYSDRGGKYDFWSIRSDGGDLRRLSDLDDSTWFPVEVAGAGFVTGHDEEGTWRLDWNADRSALGDRHPYARDMVPGRIFFGFRWSPDGRVLSGWAGESISALDPSFHWYDRQDGTLHELPLQIGAWPVTSWSPDSRTVLFLRDEAIHAFDLDSGREREVMPAGVVDNLTSFDAPAAGTAIFAVSTVVENELWLAEMGDR